MQKIDFNLFGQKLFFTLHSKNDGCYSLTELIKDFRKDNGFDPEKQARLHGYSSLYHLLESKDMWEFVKVVKRIDENGERVFYTGRHHDGLNEIKQSRRLGLQEIERRQRKKQFWLQELTNSVERANKKRIENRIPPPPPKTNSTENLTPKLIQIQKQFLQQNGVDKENVRPKERNQNNDKNQNQQFNGGVSRRDENQQPRENTFTIFRSPQQNLSFSPTFDSAELIRTLETIRIDERRKQQKTINNVEEQPQTSKKDVATETEKTCTKCICTNCARFRRVLCKIVSQEKEKRKKRNESNKENSNISNISNILSNISEQNEAELIHLSNTRESLKMRNDVNNFNENEVGDLIQFSENSSRLECEIGRNSAGDSLIENDVQNAFNSFMNDRIENLNEDDIISGNFSILKEFLIFDNDESINTNKQHLQNKQINNNKVAIPGKGSSVFIWDRKFYKKCSKCPFRQTLEHFMLEQHQSIREESLQEIEEEVSGHEENEEEYIDENSGNYSGQRNDGNLIFEQEYEENECEDNEQNNDIVEESDLGDNEENEREVDVQENESYISSEGTNSTFTDNEEQQTPTQPNQNNLQLNKNNNSNKFSCTLCNMQFNSPGGLNIHKGKSKKHRDLLLTTSRMANLMVSDSTNNNSSSLFQCNSPGCDSIFETSDKLKRHQTRQHAKRDFVCNVCGKGYVFERGLIKHKNISGH